MKELNIIGVFEPVSFPDLSMDHIVAKIDTGAYSGAIHAMDIKVKTDKLGEDYLQFRPFHQEKKLIKVKKFEIKRVKSSNGHMEKRFIIETPVVIKNKSYKTNISLTDRSEMKNDVLLGRQFLRRYHFLVDVKLGTKYVNQG